MAYAEDQITLEVVDEGGTEVFLSEPEPPYDTGDLWVDAGSDIQIGDDLEYGSDAYSPLVGTGQVGYMVVGGAPQESVVYVCTTDRSTGSYTSSDWTLAATDDTAVNELKEHFWHDSNGAHVLGDSSGFRNDITSTGMNIVDTSTETSVAEFGSSGAVIGTETVGENRAVIDSDGFRVYRKINSSQDQEIANIGYGEVNGSSGVTNAPYYTLGTRATSAGYNEKGYHSVVAGYNCEASAAYSYAGGFGCQATGMESYAHGHYTHATGSASCAEGDGTHAVGSQSHAEGQYTYANGARSHAQNYRTLASSANQTALGKYNVEDTNDTYAVIVGNGTGTNARSNALTVDWSGNVNIPTGAAYKVNGTSLIDLIYPVGSIYMSVNNTSPQTLFGGTWQQIQDTFLLAAGSTYTAGGTGGTASNTLAEANLPKITGTVKLASNIARNTDTASTLLESASGKFTRVESTNQNVVKLNSSTSTVSTGKTLYTSAKYEFGQTTPTALDNLPPYLAVYVWKRTA